MKMIARTATMLCRAVMTLVSIASTVWNLRGLAKFIVKDPPLPVPVPGLQQTPDAVHVSVVCVSVGPQAVLQAAGAVQAAASALREVILPKIRATRIGKKKSNFFIIV